jgi:hypothetical protein
MYRDQLIRLAEDLLAEAEHLLGQSGATVQAGRLEAARDFANRALELLDELGEDESLFGVIQLMAHASGEMALAKDPSIIIPDRKPLVGGFRFSGYWRTWARVLAVDHPQGQFIEVSLTPINSWAWDSDVRLIRILVHCTPLCRSRGDLFLLELPPAVRSSMVHNLGLELTQRLLTEDFLPLIDWALYREKRGTGPGLDDIRRV